MPQAVEGDLGQPLPPHHRQQVPGQLVRLGGRPVLPQHHPLLRVVAAPPLPRPPQHLLQVLEPGDAQPPGGGAGLGGLQHHAAAHLCAHLPDGEQPRLQVHILPPQAADLAAPQAQIGRQLHRQLHHRAGHGGEQQLQLLRGVKAEAGLLLLGRRHPVHGAAFQHLQPHRHAQGRGQHHIVLDDRVGGQALVHLLIEIALDTQGRQLRQRDPSQGRQHMTACHVAVGVQRALRPVPGHHLLQPEGQPLPQCAVLPRQAPVGTGVPLQRGLGLLPGAVGAGIAPSVLPEHRVIQLPLRVVCKILLDRLSGHGCIPLSFSLVLRCRRIAKGPCAADHGAA